MESKRFRAMDSDLHVFEPPDLWERYIEPAYRDRAPRGLTPREGQPIRSVFALEIDHRVYGATGQNEPEESTRKRRDYEYGLYADEYEEVEKRGYDGEAMLAAMDAEGLELAVLYPSRGLIFVSYPDFDPSLLGAISRAYNDWMHDLCQADPNRLMGAAMIPLPDVETCVLEARRTAAQYGFKAVFLTPDVYDGRGWDDPRYDPLWEECQRLGLVVGFHSTGGLGLRPGQAGGMFKTWMQVHTFAHAVPCMEAVAAFTAGGVLERFPDLKVGFLEANCSWVPWLMWRLDEHFEIGGCVERPELTMKPSEYFRRQCYVSVESDEEPARVIEEFGYADNVVFSTDFPHPDSKWPNAVERVLELPVSEEFKRKFLWDNCRALYSLR